MAPKKIITNKKTLEIKTIQDPENMSIANTPITKNIVPKRCNLPRSLFSIILIQNESINTVINKIVKPIINVGYNNMNK